MSIFFFVVGLEIKQELLKGEFSSPRKLVLPLAGALGGMVAPALVYLAVNLGHAGAAPHAWPIPTATDIAFALAGARPGRGEACRSRSGYFCSPWPSPTISGARSD